MLTLRYTLFVQNFLFMLNVSRPRFWFYIFGPYIVGLIAGINTADELSDISYLLFGLYFLLPANVLVYGINDTFDYETDIVNAKKTGYELLVPPERRISLLVFVALVTSPFVIAVVFLNLPAMTAAFVFLFLSIFYSVPPIRAKTKPFLDSAFNVLYVMPGLFAYSLVTSDFVPSRVVLAAGCWTAAMHAYSAIPDIGADREADLKTIATVCGPYVTLAVCAVLYSSAAFLSFEYLDFVSVALGLAYVFLMLASVHSVTNGRLFNLYRAFPLINAVAGFIIFWYIALEKLF